MLQKSLQKKCTPAQTADDVPTIGDYVTHFSTGLIPLILASKSVPNSGYLRKRCSIWAELKKKETSSIHHTMDNNFCEM